MTTCSRRIIYRRLRAPKEDRTAVVEPSWEQIGELVQGNLAVREQSQCMLHGRSLAELSRAAREQLLREARRWTAGYLECSSGRCCDSYARSEQNGNLPEPSASNPRETPGGPWELPPRETACQTADSSSRDQAGEPAASSRRQEIGESGFDAEGPIFLAGHQPQLFHPGVWLKNFALAYLASRHGAVAVNLVIDSDTLRSTAVAVPGGTPDRPTLENLLLDRHGPVVPYEERPILDHHLLAQFGPRAVDRLHALIGRPLLEDYWPRVVRRAEQGATLGAALAQARHQLEWSWGAETWEVPQSRVCAGEAFCWFAVHLLAELPRFWKIYNASVQEYRRVHRIRNAAQPVPDLAADDPWLEAPFWLWTAENPDRRRLFVRRAAGRLVLGDRQSLEVELPLSAAGDIAPAVDRLMELQAEGVKLRSRALITTLWARLALGELFVHGIGGAKYDQVTDLIIQDFFGLAPPQYMVLSATLYLPVERPAGDRDDLRGIREQLRRLRYHPERFLEPVASAEVQEQIDHLVAEKRRWIATPQTPQNARTRCHAIRRVNQQLQPYLAGQRRRLEALEAETLRAIRINNILGRRDYPFCFYPAAALRELFDQLLPEG